MATKKSQKLASGPCSSRRGRQQGGTSPDAQTVDAHPRVDAATLQAAEEWQRTFDAVPDPIAILDTHYRIVRVNKTMADRLGLTKDQCVGQTCYHLVHGTDEPPSFCPHARLLQDGEEHRVEVHEEWLAGDFLVSVSPRRDATGRLLGSVHVARDITEHQRAKTQFELKEAQLRTILQASPDFVWLLDKDFRILYANRAEPTQSVEDLMGISILSLLPKEKQAESQQHLERALKSRTSYEYEVELQTADGSRLVFENIVVPMKSDGQTVGLAINSRDVTARRQAAETLRFSQFAIDHFGNPIFWMDRDARFIYVNNAACRSLGYSREELLSMTTHDIDPNFPAETWSAHWKEVQQHHSLTFESRHRAKDGRIFPVEVTVNYLAYEGKEYNCAFAHDITERKRTEQALRHGEKLKAEAGRRTAIGRLAAQVVHEINNPLAGIKNSFRLIRDAVPEDHPDHDMVGRIEREIDRITHVVQQLYKLHPAPTQSPTDVPVDETIRDVSVMLEPLCRDFEVAIELAPVSPKLTIKAHPGSLQQILYNLAGNAIQASPRSGIVNIAAEPVDKDSVRISIRDQGPGIPAEVRARMFEPFFSASTGGETRTGIGLGLSIVKSIVDSLEGRIEFESRVGEGTCCRVHLPS